MTDKVWKTHMNYDKVLIACESSLQKLGLNYLDCYLIHWPVPISNQPEEAHRLNLQAWRAMERLHDEGIVREIGVANFMKRHLKPLLASANIPPAIDQIEVHPGCPQIETVSYCKENNIEIEAWSPLGSGFLLAQPDLVRISQVYNSTPAELCLNWLHRQEIRPIVRSSNKNRMYDNLHVKQYELTECELKVIAQMPEMGDENGINPDTFIL